MDSSTLKHGLTSDTKPWRPWLSQSRRTTAARKPYDRAAGGDQLMKLPVFTHPVKLFWPKSRCFDYLYRDAELLLRNYPVQATIHLYEDSDSEEEEDDDDDEEEKQLN